MEITDLLAQFDLSKHEQEAFLLLNRRGWSTVLELARVSHIKRTTLYRILESLAQKGLVETQIDDKTTYYNTADPKQFESLVINQETKAKKLRNTYDQLSQQLNILNAFSQKDETAVKFFRGINGLKHLEWKKCEHSNTEVFIFDAGDKWYEALGREFAENIRAEIVNQKITIYNLINHSATEPINDNGTCNWTDNLEYIKNHYLHRSIDTKQLALTQDIYIVKKQSTHIHGYRDGDLFGVEIISPDYAQFMFQLFISQWNQAKVIDSFGGKNLK